MLLEHYKKIVTNFLMILPLSGKNVFSGFCFTGIGCSKVGLANYSLTRGLPVWLNVQRICLPMHEMPETRIQSLGWEDHLEKGMATHSSILA